MSQAEEEKKVVEAVQLDRTTSPLHGRHTIDVIMKEEPPEVHWNDRASVSAFLHRCLHRHYKYFVASSLVVGFIITIIIIYEQRPTIVSYKSVAPTSSPSPTKSMSFVSLSPPLPRYLVRTAYGIVEGFETAFASRAHGVVKVASWRGIPFAAPPIGALRWAPPAPPSPWMSEVLLTNKFKPPCVQPSGDPLSVGSEGAEDCLYLNIYVYRSPNAIADSKPLPVMFYIYGGGLMAGWGGQDMTPFIVNAGDIGNGMVLVQVNYRVNLFGFLANAQLSSTSPSKASGNYGFQDQLLALQWVQQNIAAFGGDPTCVTIAGQSSGGTSVFALMSSPLSKGLFSASISISGSPDISLSLEQAHTQNSNIFETTSCQSFSSDASQFVACIRELPAEAVQALIPNSWNTPGIWGMPHAGGMNYDAVAIVDGVVVTESFPSALRSSLVDVPIMFGNMAYEPDEDPENIVADYSTKQWWAFLNNSFGSFDSQYNRMTGTTGTEIFHLYRNDSNVNPQKAYDAIVSDYGLTCASASLVNSSLFHGGNFKSPLYVFVNEWGLSHPYSTDTSSQYRSNFAHHDVDFWMLTESWSLIGDRSYSPSFLDLLGTSYLQNLWYEFMVNRGDLSKSTTGLFSNWLPANGGQCADIGSSEPCYNMIVINAPSAATSSTSPSTAASGSHVATNFKQNVCNYLGELGINQISYWWSN